MGTRSSRKSPKVPCDIVTHVCTILRRQYGRPRLGNPRDPLDDLIYVVLSNKTTSAMSGRVYGDLKARFPKWENLLDAPAKATQQILRPAGLSAVKTTYIRAALRKIRRDFGACDLASLRSLSTLEAETYLCSLPGVSLKVAKCVAMYTLRGQVLPVDGHVHRLAIRLGWTKKRRADQCHEELETLVPPKLRFAFHVDAILHGRLLCRPKGPLCGQCCIRDSCQFVLKAGR